MRRLREVQAAYATELADSDYPPQGQWTYEDYACLPDDGWKYEVMKGRLYITPAPAPQHQRVILRLSQQLTTYVDKRKLGEIFIAPVDVILPNALGAPVQPDIFLVNAEDAEIVGEKYVEGVPALVVDVLSPSNWLDDRRTKLEIYAEAGVSEYWIVDPRARTVEVFTLADQGYELLGRYAVGEVASSRLLDGFAVAVDAIIPA
ncbi:MAG: Uma2 family endonuclease [Caldilineaceae bacterium]